MFKIAFIGAGSLVFTRRLIQDILSVEEFKEIEISFMDIDPDNLDKVTRLCQRDIDTNGLSIKIQSTKDRKLALKGARYVVNMARIGGLEGLRQDVEIPLKYGVDQCVGDTLCAGGILYAQRGIPFIMELCRDIRKWAHRDCFVLNYANPNAMITWVMLHYGGVPGVGLCHGVQHGLGQLADALGVPEKELDYSCAGINHQTWYIQLSHKGKDLLSQVVPALEKHPLYSRTEKVRIDMAKRFGYFSTESNGHLSEYLPWYRKRPEETPRWIVLEEWIHGETAGYFRSCYQARYEYSENFDQWFSEPAFTYCEEERGNEHGSYIIEAMETGRVYRGHFNVLNRGSIGNLPDDAVVEVPGYVDRNGLHPLVVGDLPAGCAAVCNSSIQVQRLAVSAALEGDEMLLKQALLLDPLTGAVCNPPEVWQMADEMLIAGKEWLPQYAEVIKEAEIRWESEEKIPPKEITWPAKLNKDQWASRKEKNW